jgi:pantoate--beta-alanine ligase
MEIIETPRAMQMLSQQWKRAGYSIGFVPTMGALHAGHVELCRCARTENSKFIASIFVNPLQFRAGEDLEKYPRPFERDRELLADSGCDALFFPSANSMYENNGEGGKTFVEVEGVSTRWEGEVRPGHFRGVATVVAKLFNIAGAHRAYFGEKDFQQLKIIEALARDLNFETEVVACPTIRESDGLALSSRNAYLNAEERAAAPIIYRALQVGQNAVVRGEKSTSQLLHFMRDELNREPRLQIEYLATVNSDSLEPIERLLREKPARALIAARAGSTRLIDNIELRAP